MAGAVDVMPRLSCAFQQVDEGWVVRAGLKWGAMILLTVLVCLAGAVGWWTWRALPLRSASVELAIEPGTSVRQIAEEAVRSGVDVSARGLYWLFRLSGQSRQIRAGNYELTPGVSAWSLLQKLARGEESLQAVTLVEGWNLRQWRAALDKAEFLRHDTRDLTDAELARLLGVAPQTLEGGFYPDTYTYGKGSSDLKLMQRASAAMDRQLTKAWAQRAPDLAIVSPEQARILGSLIEKETGRASDRAMISSVFHNRLRRDMPLQTDPTVIYGMGEAFDGNLRRRDLRADHAWNTYTRRGLPPTPIAMPGKASLLAAVQPAHSQALYFVARGDGSSQFSETLAQHNQAVNAYQRRTGPAPTTAGKPAP
jgi:UPF0755 protein